MGDLRLETSYNDIILPTAWDIEDITPFIDIDSSGLKVTYIDPDDYKSAIIRANHPIPSQCGIFYFEIKIINKGKNGMIGIGCFTKKSDKKVATDDSDYINDILLPGQEYKENQENETNEKNEENKENELWGCGYHGDDGYSFCSGDCEKYDLSKPPGYITGDTSVGIGHMSTHF